MLLLASCGSEQARPTPAPSPSGEVLKLGYPSEPPTLDPLGVGGGSAATRDILRPVLPALFRLNARLRPEPELVETWPTSTDIRRDPFSVTLRLREAAWSDGAPITAEDVRFSLGKLRGGPTGYRYRFLREVDVHDRRTLTLRFDRPVRRWWALFSLDDMVLPAHAYSSRWDKRPTVSGGPFEVSEWTDGLRVRLVRNDSYWGPKPILAGIDVLFVPGDEIRFQLLERGELDAFFSEGDVNIGRRANARSYERIDGAIEGEKSASGAWGPSWWELDLSKLAQNVRQAVVEAADPQLVAEILEDSGEPMDGIPAVFPARIGAITGTWAGRGELEESRRSLAAGGERSFSLSYPRGTAGGIATFLHFHLREVGLKVELVGLEDDAFERSLDDGSATPAVLRIRRGADAPDAAAYASFSREPGSAAVDDFVARAETSGIGQQAAVGLGRAAWEEVQEGLEHAATATPLARVRTWIVARAGISGPRALGALTGPLWNAGNWRFT